MRFVTSANERGGFKSIHAWHSNVHENDRDVMAVNIFERILSGGCFEEVLAEVRKDLFEYEEILLFIVDEEDIGLGRFFDFVGHSSVYLLIHTRSSDNRCSASTGLAM